MTVRDCLRIAWGIAEMDGMLDSSDYESLLEFLLPYLSLLMTRHLPYGEEAKIIQAFAESLLSSADKNLERQRNLKLDFSVAVRARKRKEG